ncbi:threonine synthase [Pseudoflavonifractor capillosus]|uniref:threonine synthase n=1 Tax=Pseudoflavonifractor capillosus TaxID=106588 RepID=UPI001957D24D|nr:threonine synthase [Pseudoflavonifractor capillosus]MBM6897032.1 threonine synthase [Pseudoflavonifractor capillosus]
MNYLSTRDNKLRMSAAQAISKGLAPDGGLMTPQVMPRLAGNALERLKDMSYQQRAVYVLTAFLEGFSSSELTNYARAAYGEEKFSDPDVAPVRAVDENTHCMELWHGPTCAFKDMALQMLPHLLTASLVKTDEKRTVCILVATSGDTGKGALEGFKDVSGTQILVFYPKDGVSDIQQLQMVTQEGENVGVCAVVGNFDDAQTGVKKLFSDEKLAQQLSERGYFLSSANSINWGRVLPQIVYYISAYCDLRKQGAIEQGQEINVCVPTGNFGNILAAYYAKMMGVPIKTLICASNENNVLTDFIRTGVYDRNRPFHNTLSPSMDILISSNLERLLFELSGRDDKLVASYMEQLAQEGRYEVDKEIKAKLQQTFAAGYCDDVQTKKTIAKMWKEKHYLIDPHTAVAFDVLEQYRKDSGDQTVTVVVSTASPFKFCSSVLDALGEKEFAPGTEILDQLSQLTGVEVPKPLAALKDKQVRFDTVTEKEHMVDQVLAHLKQQ